MTDTVVKLRLNQQQLDQGQAPPPGYYYPPGR